MDKRKSKKELEVDFIGGEELTDKEKALLKNHFAKKKEQRTKESIWKLTKDQR